MSLWRRKSSPEGPADAERPAPDRSADAAREAGGSATPPSLGRESAGIQGFLGHLSGRDKLHLLDLGTLSQHTTRVLGGLGHQIHCASMLQSFDEALRASKNEDGTLDRNAANRFAKTQLNYPQDRFDGILAWDVLQHLDEVTQRIVISYLAKIVRPDGVIFCLFHFNGHDAIPVLHCSLTSDRTLTVSETGRSTLRPKLEPRSVESLFPQFRGVHFLLRRDSLLEVLVFS